MKVLIIFLFSISQAYSFEVLDISYSLPAKDREKAGPLIEDRKFEEVEEFEDEEESEVITVFPEKMETLGMSSDLALQASRDAIQTGGCSSGHDQGDLANRWCHSALARTFSALLEEKGVSKAIASLAGGVFWAPKEFFYDLHPSAGDFVVTYQDSLGTKRTTFEVTVYGDALFAHRPFEKPAPFKASTPFITIRRRLGPK
ncbi:MAG: hypothetical protein V4598_19990 [Bdellovibrionota bacterium]